MTTEQTINDKLTKLLEKSVENNQELHTTLTNICKDSMKMKRNNKPGVCYIPYTPAGTCLAHLEANTEDKAWANLLKDAAHMPYKTKENFIKRGYTVEKFEL